MNSKRVFVPAREWADNTAAECRYKHLEWVPIGFNLCPEEDQSILVEVSARFSARFYVADTEPFTVQITIS